MGVSGALAQPPDISRMSRDERAAYAARISAESEKSWQRMIGLVNMHLPASLPAPAMDVNRPPNTYQKNGSSNWYDSAGNFYARSAWGTWNNYDETKANPYPDLPDPLRCTDGSVVRDEEEWWSIRRPQIESAFTSEIFGREPENIPSVKWEVLEPRDTIIGTTTAVTKQLVGHVDNSIDTNISVDIQASLTIPKSEAGPVPVIMEFGFVFPPGFTFPGIPKGNGPSWQEQILEKGWGYAVYVPTSVQADNAAGLTEGIIGLVNKGAPPTPDDWGALRAWAWGASRVLDYFETDTSVDAKKVGIEGVSRYGKAVLTAMAYDRRFAIVLVGSSGKGGAALYRREYGESMGNICSSGEYHWFAGNFIRYVLSPNALTVDSHELIALCAPRPVFVSCGSPEVEGRWVDDRGQFMAEVAAGPVYTLFGKRDLGTSVMPPIGTLVGDGPLVFRQHPDGHTVGPNWPYFLRLADQYFGSIRR